MKSFRLFVRRLAILVVSTTLGTAAVIALSATPAHATYLTIEKTKVCDKSTGNFVVTWRVRNDFGVSGVLSNVVFTPSGTGPASIANGVTIGANATLTGVQTVPGTTTSASLALTVTFNNRYHTTRDHSRSITFGETCEQDRPQYDATSTSDCDSISVTVTNTGKIAITGTVTSGSQSKPFTLAPNATSEPFEFAGGDGVTATVAVQGAQPKPFTWDKPEDCPTTPPPATTTPPLPVTGASLTTLIGVGGALVLVGGALLMVLRFRRRLGES